MYDPEPKFQPEVQPRVQPKVTVPSYLRESGQVGNWLFYNGAGEILYDFSGEENHGDIIGPKWIDGPYGWALSFDGEDDYVDVPHSSELVPDHVTVMGWFTPDSDALGVSTMPVGKGNAGAQHGYYINAHLDDVWEWYISVGGADYIIRGGTVEAGVWKHVAGTFDGSDQHLYINGSEVASQAVSGTIDSNTWDVFIGSGQDSSGANDYWFPGDIKMVLIYNEGKSASFINRFFESTRAIFGV